MLRRIVAILHVAILHVAILHVAILHVVRPQWTTQSRRRCLSLEQERNYVYESMRHSERPVLDETDPHGSNHE